MDEQITNEQLMTARIMRGVKLVDNSDKANVIHYRVRKPFRINKIQATIKSDDHTKTMQYLKDNRYIVRIRE